MSRRAHAAIAIAVSTGGIQALRRLFAGLPGDFPLPLLVVLHTASADSRGLCAVLQAVTALPVREAELGVRPLAGIHIAPPGYHLLVEADGRFALSVDDKVCHVRPSADVLFESASDAWEDALIAIVLTGANDDGARGLAAVRARGGYAIVQDPLDAEMPGMPEAALRIAGADRVLPLHAIGPMLIGLAGRDPVLHD